MEFLLGFQCLGYVLKIFLRSTNKKLLVFIDNFDYQLVGAGNKLPTTLRSGYLPTSTSLPCIFRSVREDAGRTSSLDLMVGVLSKVE